MGLRHFIKLLHVNTVYILFTFYTAFHSILLYHALRCRNQTLKSVRSVRNAQLTAQQFYALLILGKSKKTQSMQK